MESSFSGARMDRTTDPSFIFGLFNCCGSEEDPLFSGGIRHTYVDSASSVEVILIRTLRAWFVRLSPPPLLPLSSAFPRMPQESGVGSAAAANRLAVFVTPISGFSKKAGSQEHPPTPHFPSQKDVRRSKPNFPPSVCPRLDHRPDGNKFHAHNNMPQPRNLFEIKKIWKNYPANILDTNIRTFSRSPSGSYKNNFSDKPQALD